MVVAFRSKMKHKQLRGLPKFTLAAFKDEIERSGNFVVERKSFLEHQLQKIIENAGIHKHKTPDNSVSSTLTKNLSEIHKLIVPLGNGKYVLTKDFSSLDLEVQIKALGLFRNRKRKDLKGFNKATPKNSEKVKPVDPGIIKMSRGEKGWWLATLKEMKEKGVKWVHYKELAINQREYLVEVVKTKAECLASSANHKLNMIFRKKMGLVIKLGSGKYALNPKIKFPLKIEESKKESEGEAKVEGTLKKLKIKFSRQKTFRDLKDKSFLRFDFFAKDKGIKFAVEFDGEQHFRYIQIFHRTPQGFEDQKRRDRIKNEWCRKHKIPLLRISYRDKDRVQEIVEEFVKNLKCEKPRLRSQVQKDN